MPFKSEKQRQLWAREHYRQRYAVPEDAFRKSDPRVQVTVKADTVEKQTSFNEIENLLAHKLEVRHKHGVDYVRLLTNEERKLPEKDKLAIIAHRVAKIESSASDHQESIGKAIPLQFFNETSHCQECNLRPYAFIVINDEQIGLCEKHWNVLGESDYEWESQG